MSGFFGIYHRDGRPQDSSILSRVAESMDHRGPDGADVWKNGALALGHCMLRTTPESLGEKLPYADNDAGLVITSDARIDNREELAKQLGLAERLKSGIPDSQLILAAYKKWSEKCVDFLLGDFAFAIWDANQQYLYCARDNFGVKPFYYYISNTTFIFGCEIKQVAEHPLVPLNINKGILTEYLANYFISKDETHFVDIKRLPAAHYMIIESNKEKIHKYWELKPQTRIWYKHDSEYGDHFFDVFSDAVQCRMRSNEKIGANLSGGLDSSSIVGMSYYLDGLLKKYNVETFSLTFPGQLCDESVFINAVNQRWNCSSCKFAIHDFRKQNFEGHIKNTMEMPDPPNLTMMDPLMKEIEHKDIHVMLSGIGGDEIFYGSPYVYLDLFLGRKWKCITEELQLRAKSGTNKELVRLGANMFWPILPKSIKGRLLLSRIKPEFPPWLSNRVITKLLERTRTNIQMLGEEFKNLSDRTIFIRLMEPWLANVFELNDRYSSYHHVENRYPFLDRRMVEFALSIPEYERSRKNITKYILRTAGKELLPQNVIDRSDKAEFSSVFLEPMKNGENANVLKFKEIRQIDPELNETLLIENYHQLYESGADTGYIWPIWFAFSIETFLNQCPLDDIFSES